MHLVPEHGIFEALDLWQKTILSPPSLDSFNGELDSAALLESTDWSLSMPNPDSASEALFTDNSAGEGSSQPLTDTSYASWFENTGSPSFAGDIQILQPNLTRNATFGSPHTSSLSNGSPYLPSNVRFLLSHYMNHVIGSLSGLPQSEAPWKGIHVPYAMTAYGELDVMGRSSLARVSLLYSLLALTCYHLGALYGPSSSSIDRGSDTQLLLPDDQASTAQFWNSQGLKFREIARTAFRKCLNAMSKEPAERIKYKELFVSAMNLICTGVCLFSTRLTSSHGPG